MQKYSRLRLRPRARESAQAAAQTVLNDFSVDGIKDDHCVVAHAECGGRIYPIAVPSALAERRINFRGVFAALAADEDFATREFAQIGGIFERAAIAGFFRKRSD